MTEFRLTRETFFFLLAFLLALVVRFAALSALPLSDSEAALALQALGLSRGQTIVLDPHPLYLVLTTTTFTLFGAGHAVPGMFAAVADPGNFVARMWDALAGSLLVWVPYLFRRPLSRAFGVIVPLLIAFFLAIDPGLAAISRQAGSPILAISFLLLALGMLSNRRYAFGGILFGLALLGGPFIWLGLIALGIALWAAPGWRELIQPAPQPGEQVNGNTNDLPRFPFGQVVRIFGYYALGTVLSVGSLFFLLPTAWGAAAASLPAYLSGWVTPSTVPVEQVLGGLLYYEFFPLLAGCIGLAIFWKQPIARFMAAFALLSILLSVIAPGRQVAGIAWASLPLWVLACGLLERVFNRPASERLFILGQMVLILVILAFIFLDLLSIVSNTSSGQLNNGGWIGLAGALALLLATTILVAWGWSLRVALFGMTWAVVIIVALSTLSAAWDAVGFSGHQRAEFWSSGPDFQDADLMRQTMSNLALQKIGARNRLQIAVVGLSSPGLEWMLRDEQNVSYVDSLTLTSAPDLVITQATQSLSIGKNYSGEAFILQQTPVLSFNDLSDWLTWWVFRSANMQSDKIILWARTDLFPGGSQQTSNNPPPP